MHRFHPPGEYVEFDYGLLKLNIGGKGKKVYFAVYTFPYSLYDFIFVSTKQDSEAFTDSFNALINHIGKVPPMVVFDNMKIGISRRSKKTEGAITDLFVNL